MAQSIVLLIDGYNVIAPVAGPSRDLGSRHLASRDPDANWLYRERMSLLERLATRLPSAVCRRTCVVFDAANPPPDRPNRFVFKEIDVRFSVGYAEADDLLEEIISQHHSPKRLTVVSSDRRVQTAIDRRGGKSYESQPWLDDLLDGQPQLIAWPKEAKRDGSNEKDASEKADQPLDEADVKHWMGEFGISDDL